jgi:hypothetical protein
VCIWWHTSSMQQPSTHKFHYQIVVQCLYLLYSATACFGHILWPPSGSCKFDRRVQSIWQLGVIDRQTMYVHVYNIIIIQWWLSLCKPLIYKYVDIMLKNVFFPKKWSWKVVGIRSMKSNASYPSVCGDGMCSCIVRTWHN